MRGPHDLRWGTSVIASVLSVDVCSIVHFRNGDAHRALPINLDESLSDAQMIAVYSNVFPALFIGSVLCVTTIR